MSQQTFHIPSNELCSFSTLQEDYSFFANQPWCRPEVQIISIEAGAGFYVTDKNIVPFGTGDIFMTGSNFTHQFKLNERYSIDSGKPVRVSVVRFLPDFWGDVFLNLDENTYIRILLKKAALGIITMGQDRIIIRSLMEQVMRASGTGKIITLLKLLHKIYRSCEH